MVFVLGVLRYASRLLALLLLSVFPVGCDPQQRILVRTVDPTGAPIGSLEVELFCPANRPWRLEGVYQLGVTDSNGTLMVDEVGATPVHCLVRTSQLKGTTVKVDDVCTEYRTVFGSCLAFEAKLTVER